MESILIKVCGSDMDFSAFFQKYNITIAEVPGAAWVNFATC